MPAVDIHEAQRHLAKFVDAAVGGVEFVITKAGKPVARLAPIESERKIRRFGGLKGRLRLADDFDAPLPDDIIAEFESR
jgi:prevent-host-death family protein